MEDIVVIGAGGFARETKNLIKDINSDKQIFNFLGYLVSDKNKYLIRDSNDEILGDFSWFAKRKDRINVVLGLGNPDARINLSYQILQEFSNVKFPVLIHPSVIYDVESCFFERGVIVCASNIFTVNVTMGEFSMINLNCTIGHETIIGAGSVINPGVNISGNVDIGKNVFVGTGAQILEKIKIGKNAIIGAGACVTKEVENKTTVVGVPAKPIRQK